MLNINRAGTCSYSWTQSYNAIIEGLAAANELGYVDDMKAALAEVAATGAMSIMAV